VVAGGFVCATAVLLPYHGVALTDVFWAAGAGGTTALAFWRWSDARAVAAEPTPPELTDAQRAALTQHRLESVVGKLPIGRTAINEMHRVAHLSRVRGSAIGPAATRLDKATKAFNGLVPRLTGPAHDVVSEATGAERALRDLAERIASVERAMKMPGAGAQVAEAHNGLIARFTVGVEAYEALVAAAAGYVAEDGHLGSPMSIVHLIEAGDMLKGIADGMGDMRTRTNYPNF
jgi:hypothetical protein